MGASEKENNIKTRHEAFVYQPADKLNKMLLALSPDTRNNSALINQDAFFSVSHIQKGITLDYTINISGNGVYIHCVNGIITIDNYTLHEGDALGAFETDLLTLKVSETAELIFVEVPMHRSVPIN